MSCWNLTHDNLRLKCYRAISLLVNWGSNPSPAPFYQSELDSKLVRIKKFDFALWMGGQSARATMKNSLIRRESPMQINGTFNID
jgi:hypothetical protein